MTQIIHGRHIGSDLTELLKKADSIIIDSEPKVGKVTFALYLIKFLFHEKVLFFTPNDAYLFRKKILLLSKQFTQFSDIDDYITRYFLQEEWYDAKRQYGYEFLLTEFERIVLHSEEKIIIFYRIEDFFEFQDRYEIDHFYKSLIKIATSNNKKIIFLVNEQHQNHQYIYNVAEEFSDVAIRLSKDVHNERLVDIKNILTYEEHPQLQFQIEEKNLTLKYVNDEDKFKKRVKNIFIMNLDTQSDSSYRNIVDICNYIIDREEFHLANASSLQGMLKHIFMQPDIIIIVMNRSEENFETIEMIKKQFSKIVIMVILEQDFLRTEDMRKAYDFGCDEIFPRTYLFDKFILSLQKYTKTTFYSDAIKALPEYENNFESLAALKSFVDICIEHALFFTMFVVKNNNNYDKLKSTKRALDYICETEDKIYYLAMNTMPNNVGIILEKQYEEYNTQLELLSVCTPIDMKKVEECLI